MKLEDVKEIVEYLNSIDEGSFAYMVLFISFLILTMVVLSVCAIILHKITENHSSEDSSGSV